MSQCNLRCKLFAYIQNDLNLLFPWHVQTFNIAGPVTSTAVATGTTQNLIGKSTRLGKKLIFLDFLFENIK